MAEKPLPILPREWRESAQRYADDRGLGPLDSVSADEWQAVLKHVETKMHTEGFVVPEGWQEALAKQAGRPDA